ATPICSRRLANHPQLRLENFVHTAPEVAFKKTSTQRFCGTRGLLGHSRSWVPSRPAKCSAILQAIRSCLMGRATFNTLQADRLGPTERLETPAFRGFYTKA